MKRDILKQMQNPIEPIMPDDVEAFIKTDLGKKVHEYYMSELEFTMCEGYNEWLEMLTEEREKVKKLEQQLNALKK